VLESLDLLAIVGAFEFSSLPGVEVESGAGLFIELLAGSLADVELEGSVFVDEDDETGGVIASDLDASFDVGDWLHAARNNAQQTTVPMWLTLMAKSSGIKEDTT
jgi:hypothetical protein